MQLFGIDFTSAPTRRKPIVIARGHAVGPSLLEVEGYTRLERFDLFEIWLHRDGPWLGGFDFPFGLPRSLLESLDWPHRGGWAESIRHIEGLSRAEMVCHFRAFCAARPIGNKFAHRATDRPAGSSPSMKWVNPPVAFMLHAGAPRLLNAGVDLPGIHAGDPNRIALEAYPGLLARAIAGRESYKSDERAKQTRDRMARREVILEVLRSGRHSLGITVQLPRSVEQDCLDDGSGDCLDALLCLVQAAWAWQRRDQHYGLPESFDPVEGWIVSARDSENGISA